MNSDAVSRLLTRVQRATVSGEGWIALCPAHEDMSPSLSIHEGRDGRALVKCFAGCELDQILAALGMAKSDLFDTSALTGVKNEARCSAKYTYVDEEGRNLFQVRRYESELHGSTKAFRQFRYEGGQWVPGLQQTRRVLFKLPRLMDAVKAGRMVFVVEGEKDAEALLERGLIATTSPGGAGKWRREYCEFLGSAKVVILPDNDTPGRSHAEKIASMLAGVAAEIRVVTLPGIAEKEDVSDWLNAGGTVDQLKALVRTTPRWKKSAESQPPPNVHKSGPIIRGCLQLIDAAKGNAHTEASHEKKTQQQNPSPFATEEPWPTPVDGAEVLDALSGLITKYVVLPAWGAEILALWIAHTYVVDVADFTPYLWVNSPVRECGKSTLLELLSYLVFHGQLTGGITAAALYRRIDRLHPTMLLDELDTKLRSDAGENLRAVLNTGFHRSGKMTICVGDQNQDKDFSTFCPKVLAGIGRLWDTVTSRSIPLRLQRASKSDLVKLGKVRGDRIGDECHPYRQKLLRWCNGLSVPLRVADPPTPLELGARQCDVWRPLFAIADAAGGRWPQTARYAALSVHGVGEDETDYGLLLLQDIRDLFLELGDERLSSTIIAARLAMIEERPWPEYRHGKPITPSGIAFLLKRFGVKPKNLRGESGVHKGYELTAFHEPFALYLPPLDTAATPATEVDVAAVAEESQSPPRAPLGDSITVATAFAADGGPAIQDPANFCSSCHRVALSAPGLCFWCRKSPPHVPDDNTAGANFLDTDDSSRGNSFEPNP